MNARQKAKRYKLLYEQLKNKPIMFEVLTEKHDTKRLRVMRAYPQAVIAQGNMDYLRDVIRKDIAIDMAGEIIDYIDFKSEYCPEQMKYLFSGEIQIINKR